MPVDDEVPTEVEVVRHVERLLVGRERRAAQRVRVTKQIVTTTRTLEVPVRLEQLVVSYETLDEDLGEGPPSSGPVEPLVLVLHEEVPEVTLRVAPVERVTVAVRDVVGEQTVTATLAGEHVEVEEIAPETSRVTPGT